MSRLERIYQMMSENFFDNFYKINKKLGDILLSRTIINDNDLNRDRVIPYLSEQGYYKLQSILNSEDIPKIYICDLLELLNKLDSKYDIVILSNIFMYLNMDVLEFKEFLKLFKSKLKDGGIIQANYVWNNKAEVFKKNGFIVKHVPSAIYDYNKIDSVLSLKL